MNKRIKTLATQAGGEFYEGNAGSPTSIKFSEDELVKFVEFLLDEAADEIREIDGNDYQTELFDAFDL
jgi:hypothetical protein